MPNESASSSRLVPNWLTLILAVWLFISPWVLAAPATGAWAWNAWIVAILVAAASIAALSQTAQWEDWVNLVLGAWLFISPWIYGYSGTTDAAWNSYIVGALIFLISIWGIVAARQSSPTAGAHS
jgi:hypothetical protein